MTSTAPALPGQSARLERLDSRCKLCKGISAQESLSVFWDREAFFVWSAFAKLDSREVANATAEKILVVAFRLFSLGRQLESRGQSSFAASFFPLPQRGFESGQCLLQHVQHGFAAFFEVFFLPFFESFLSFVTCAIRGASSCFLNDSIQVTYRKKEQRAGGRRCRERRQERGQRHRLVFLVGLLQIT